MLGHKCALLVAKSSAASAIVHDVEAHICLAISARVARVRCSLAQDEEDASSQKLACHLKSTITWARDILQRRVGRRRSAIESICLLMSDVIAACESTRCDAYRAGSVIEVTVDFVELAHRVAEFYATVLMQGANGTVSDVLFATLELLCFSLEHAPETIDHNLLSFFKKLCERHIAEQDDHNDAAASCIRVIDAPSLAVSDADESDVDEATAAEENKRHPSQGSHPIEASSFVENLFEANEAQETCADPSAIIMEYDDLGSPSVDDAHEDAPVVPKPPAVSRALIPFVNNVDDAVDGSPAIDSDEVQVESREELAPLPIDININQMIENLQEALQRVQR